jgi:hypothetical protein
MSEAWKSRLLAAAIVALPVHAAAQLTVTDPAPGQAVSYRNSQIQWLPMPGVTDYHLQVDDDPAFRSPEIDVVVHQPAYQLSGGDRLRLNGRLSWAAYVRVNGVRWSAPAFTPSYVTHAYWPEVAAGIDGKVYYAYLSDLHRDPIANVRTSDDFGTAIRLSPAETDTNPHGITVEVDPSGVAHVFWTEQIHGRGGIPFYANSIDWLPAQVRPDGVGGIFDVGPSMVITETGVHVFDEVSATVQQFTSTGGGAFTVSPVPDSAYSATVQASPDGPSGILLAEERLGNEIVLQRSATGWTPEPVGPGNYPSAAAGADGVVHVVMRSTTQGFVWYSNSRRFFATWNPLPVPPVLGQQLLPIVVDDARQRVYVAAHSVNGTQLCQSATAGESWSCRAVGGGEAQHPNLTLDPTGVLHLAWADVHGGGYATSLGSFLAVNGPPEAHLSDPVPWPNTVIIPSAVSDRDGDGVAGSVAVGTNALRRMRLVREDTFPILGDEVHFNGIALFPMNRTILFRAPGRGWTSTLALEGLVLPATVHVQTLEGRTVDVFTIQSWRSGSAVIDRWEFTAHVREPFESGRLPLSIDISSAPVGLLTMRVAAHDGASWRVFDAPFVRVDGRDRLSLVDFRPAAEGFMSALEATPAGNFRAPVYKSVLGSEMNGVVFAIERALVAPDAQLRAGLLDLAGSRLRSRVLARMNGCLAGGKPDEDDWVIDCGDQQRLRVAAGQVLVAIEALR